MARIGVITGEQFRDCSPAQLPSVHPYTPVNDKFANFFSIDQRHAQLAT